MKNCDLCGNATLIAGTFLVYTSYRVEDRDYIILSEERTGKKKGYFKVVRYCPSCLMKYCVGSKYA